MCVPTCVLIFTSSTSDAQTVLQSSRENDDTKLPMTAIIAPRTSTVQPSSKTTQIDLYQVLKSGDVPLGIWKSMKLIGGATYAHLVLALDEQILVLDTTQVLTGMQSPSIISAISSYPLL